MSIALILVIVALVFTLGAAMGKLPLWPAVLMLVLVHLLGAYPLR